jgi:hypothetical protein
MLMGDVGTNAHAAVMHAVQQQQHQQKQTAPWNTLQGSDYP